MMTDDTDPILINEQIDYLLEIYGTIPKLAKALSIDRTYLYRLYVGEKKEPSDEILSKLGLEKVVTYYSKAP